MARTSLTVRVEGDAEVIRAFDRLPPQAKLILKAKTLEVSEDLARAVRVAAAASSAQSALMAPTVRAERGLSPAVTAGGTTLVGRNQKPAFKVLYGSEFGSHTLRQFRPFVGSTGYWFFRTQQAEAPRIERQWQSMADELVRRWGA